MRGSIMPRIRSIKPQFWLDENLGNISRDARLLYIGLWNLSDDQGVFEWRPGRIKIQLFPYDNDIAGQDINEWLGLLIETGDIIKFEYNGHTFGYIKSFLEHQKIDRPSEKKFAPIPDEFKTPLPLAEDSSTYRLPLALGSREGGVGSREEGIGNIYIPYPEFTNIKLSTEEHQKLIKLFGESGAKDRIEALSLYKRSKGKKYKDDYATILAWERKDNRERDIKQKKDDPDKYIKGKYGHLVHR
jgi:hypothetical protein